jgi:hypothetical protein
MGEIITIRKDHKQTSSPGPLTTSAKRTQRQRFLQKLTKLEDNTGHIGHHMWLDQNRIVTLFRELALNT